MGKGTTTDNTELETAARALLGPKFLGVFASDEKVPLTARKPYAIINTDPRSSGGEHWVAIARVPTGQIMFYDSFGEDTELFPRKFRNAIDTEDDVEQLVQSTNCGQRSLAWLVLFDKFGTKAAKKI